MKARLGQTTTAPSPVESAPVSQNHAQNVYPTKSTHSVTSRPPSAARGRHHVRGTRAIVARKKESSDESTETETDSSDDTN